MVAVQHRVKLGKRCAWGESAAEEGEKCFVYVIMATALARGALRMSFSIFCEQRIVHQYRPGIKSPKVVNFELVQ